MPRYAAVDIGSNSVRMEVAEISPPENGRTPAVRILASDREVTRLGEGVFRAGRVSPEAMALTGEVLARFAKTHQRFDLDGIRVVATSAIRDARNQEEFLTFASRAIGARVEVISGAEEARLIHLGVQLRWPHTGKRVLIVDIGGGSAELILGDRGSLGDAYSKPLGAVRLTEMFLKTDPPAPAELDRLRVYIDQKLARPVETIGRAPIDRVIATSASANAVVCAVNRLPRTQREKADRMRASLKQIRKLFKQVASLSLDRRRGITGIGPKRAEIIIPGVTVLLRTLESFRQPTLYYSAGGLRDGIVADLFARGVGRELSMLARDQRKIVEQLARHYGVELPHARKVAELSHSLFVEAAPLHGLPRAYGKLLQAAALLKDVGHYVSDTRHHRHSYYLIANSPLAGFTAIEREFIANLCRYHRKSVPTTFHPTFAALPAEEQEAVRKLVPLLRIADALDRAQKQTVRGVRCLLNGDSVEVSVDSGSDAGIELWAAEQNREVFQEVFGRSLTFRRSA
ncbi:MAG: Ppx/GppA family phosphatase [Bryobacteraceae bacterium]